MPILPFNYQQYFERLFIPRITQNTLNSQIFDLFTKSSSGHKWNVSLKTRYYASFIKSRM